MNVFNTTPVQPDDELRLRMRAVRFVRDFIAASDRYRKPHLELAEKCRDWYRAWEELPKSIIQRANLKLPIAFQIIEAQLPHVYKPFTQKKPFIRFSGRDEIDMQFQDGMTEFFSMQFDQMGDGLSFRPQFMAFAKGLLLDGTAIARVPYEYEEKTIKRSEFAENELGEVEEREVEEDVVVRDGPGFYKIPLQDFYPDPAVKEAGNIQKMRGCVEQNYADLRELREEPDYEKAMPELLRSISVRGTKNPHVSPYWEEEHASDNERGVKEAGQVTLWHYWGLFDTTGKGDYEEYHIVIGNGDVCLLIEENPYHTKFKPYVACVNIIRDNEFYGIPEVLPVIGYIRESQSLRNARLDQINLAVNRGFIVDRNAGINMRRVYLRPNVVIPANDIKGIRELPVPEVPASSFAEVREIGSDIQTTIGSPEGPHLGQMATTFGRSATGVQAVNNIAASRAALKIDLLCDLLFRPLVRIMMQMNAQFIEEDLLIRMRDPESPHAFGELPLEAFATWWDFDVIPNVEDNKAERLEGMMQFIQLAQIIEQSQPYTVNFAAIGMRMGRELLGRDIKPFIRKPEEVMQLQQAAAQAQQQANAAAGQRAPQPNRGTGAA